MVDGLPTSVAIREVGPRDGFQNEPETIPTDDKVRLIDALARTGLRRLEVTSFVRSDVIAQLADAEEVLTRIEVPDEVGVSVLIPNERGLDRALALRERFDEVSVFLSATETHNARNVNRSVEDSLSSLERVLERARGEGLRCEAVIAVSFGCPYEGAVPHDRVLGLARRLRDAGAQELAFGDTPGVANPRQVRTFFESTREHLGDGVQLTAHFHNTRGQGLANVLAALEAGCTSFESSFGELGGCPVPPGATGNIATEDLVSMLHEMGVQTGIDLPALLTCARDVQEVLGRPLGSHTLVAGPVDRSSSDRLARARPQGPRWGGIRPVVSFCLRRGHLRRSVTTAAIVGLVLTLINQADVIVGPDTPGITWLKVGLNFVVPFVVTNVGILAGRSERERAEA